MKKLLTLLVILVMGLAAMAQSPVPAKLNYQAVVRSSDNHLASNKTVSVTIKIKDGSTLVYQEVHNSVNTNINGLLNLVIGDGIIETGALADVNWTDTTTIHATILWDGNTVETVNPVYAVPLALQALSSPQANWEETDVDNPTYIQNKPDLTIYAEKAAPNTFDTTNIFKDTLIVEKGAVKADGSIDANDSLRAVNAKDMVVYTGKAIHDSIVSNFSNALTDSLSNYLTINGLCDSIKNNCSSVAFQDESNTFQEDNTFAKKNTFTDTVIVEKGAVQPGGSIGANDSLRVVNATDLVNYTDSLINNTFGGLCDSIKKCDDVAFRTDSNNFTMKNVFKDTVIVEKGAVGADGSIGANDSLRAINATDLVNYTSNAIHDSIVNNIADQIRDSIAANALDCSDIADCLVSEIQNNNTDLIKTIDSVTYQNTLDSIQKATSELNHAIDTIVGNTIHDSIVNNIADQIRDSIAANALDCDDIAECIITNDDAKENIIKIVSDTLSNGNSELNHIVDTIAGASQVNADWNATSGKAKILNKPTTISGYGITDASINTTTRVITLGTNTITVPEIPTNNTTADNLCDQIAAAECPSIAYLTKDNAFTGKNTFSDNTTFSDTVVVPNVIESDSTFATGDATQAVNALDVQKYVTKAVVTLEKQTSYKVASATANQTAFALTIPAGYTAVNSDTRLVQLYINGVYVGDNVDGVVTVSGTNVTYVPANNDSYALVAGDRIQIVYWVKK